MKIRLPRRLGWILCTLAAAVALAGIVQAIPDTDGVIRGCHSKATGALRVIDPSVETCSNRELPIFWNQTGPEGPAGPAGEPGPSGVAAIKPVAGVGAIAASTSLEFIREQQSPWPVVELADGQRLTGVITAEGLGSFSASETVVIHSLCYQDFSGDPPQPFAQEGSLTIGPGEQEVRFVAAASTDPPAGVYQVGLCAYAPSGEPDFSSVYYTGWIMATN